MYFGILTILRRNSTALCLSYTKKYEEFVMEENTSTSTEDTTCCTSRSECAVCLQPYVQPVRLPCDHVFCYLCVKGVTHQSRRCAMCRQAIPLNYLDNPQLIAAPHQNLTFDGSYQWFYEGRNGWWQYDDRTSLEIESSYRKGEKSCEVLIAGFLYNIDFQEKVQVRRCDSHRKRRIKRDLISIPKKGVAGIRLPAELPEPAALPIDTISIQDEDAEDEEDCVLVNECQTSSDDDS